MKRLPVHLSTCSLILVSVGCGSTSADSTTTVGATGETQEGSSAVFEVTYVEGEGCTSVGPSQVPTGEHSFVLHDPSGELESTWVIRVDEGKTLQDAIDAAPGPGKWYPKQDWQHYTIDLDSGEETDDGTVFVKGLPTPGTHLVVVSLYEAVETTEDRIFWWCSPSFRVVADSE
jgi:hypothetical protein